MRSVLIATVLGLCASACGRFAFDPLDDAGGDITVAANIPSWTNGTRLRARVADFGGGARELLGWFDSELGVNCRTDGVSPAGDHYCFPVATNVVFLDAGCTMPIGAWNPGSGIPLPTRAYDVQLLGGQFVYRHYPLAAEMFGVTYYSGAPGSCNGPYPQGSQRIFALDPEIDPTTFVRLSDARIGTGRLKQDGWQGDDGSQYFDKLFDNVRHLHCHFAQTTDDARCVTDADGTFYFADANCTVPLSEPSAAGDTEGINYVEPCGLTHRHERGAAFTGQAYQSINGTCTSTSTTGLVMLGAEIAPDIFISADRITGTQTGRLVASIYLGLDGTVARTAWRDTMRGSEECGLSTGLSFGTRCLPYLGVSSLGEYSDSACTLAMATVIPANSTSGACPAKYIYEADSRGPAIHAVNASAPPPTQQFHYSFSCNGDVFDSAVSHVVGGAALSFDSFASATERVE